MTGLLNIAKHLQGQHDQQSHGRGSSVNIGYYDPESMWELDEDEIPEGDPYDIANRAGIHVSRDKDPRYIATDENNNIIGASFIGIDHSDETYTFDIVVDPDHQRKGIGSKLLDITIDDFNAEASEYGIESMETEVVNEAMKRMLERRGGTVLDKSRSGWLMELRP